MKKLCIAFALALLVGSAISSSADYIQNTPFGQVLHQTGCAPFWCEPTFPGQVVDDRQVIYVAPPAPDPLRDVIDVIRIIKILQGGDRHPGGGDRHPGGGRRGH